MDGIERILEPIIFGTCGVACSISSRIIPSLRSAFMNKRRKRNFVNSLPGSGIFRPMASSKEYRARPQRFMSQLVGHQSER
jgi:hypothetical protein